MKPSTRKPTGDSSHLRKTSELPGRALSAANRLCGFKAIFEVLLQDENFITLLRAESKASMPAYLFSDAMGAD